MHRLTRSVLVIVTSLALAACGSSGSPGSSAGGSASVGGGACQPTTEAGGVAVTIDNFAFAPKAIEARVGQPITWTNAENIDHGAVLDDDASCSTGTLTMGKSGSLAFGKPGTYAYHCTVHGTSMTGTITISG